MSQDKQVVSPDNPSSPGSAFVITDDSIQKVPDYSAPVLNIQIEQGKGRITNAIILYDLEDKGLADNVVTQSIALGDELLLTPIAAQPSSFEVTCNYMNEQQGSKRAYLILYDKNNELREIFCIVLPHDLMVDEAISVFSQDEINSCFPYQDTSYLALNKIEMQREISRIRSLV